MKIKSVETHTVSIYMGGDIYRAREWLRRYCDEVGLCVTTTPLAFTFTKGEEEGFVVGLVNYPRFPSTPLKLLSAAEKLALGLLDICGQRSALIVTPTKTVWFSREPGFSRELE